MKQIRRYRKGVSIFLAVLFSIYATGCYSGIWVTLPRASIARLRDKPLNIMLTTRYSSPEFSEVLGRSWRMETDSVDQQYLNGTIRLMTKTETRKIRYPKGSRKEQMRQHLILLQLNDQYAAALPDTLTTTIPLDQVRKAEIHEFKLMGTLQKYTWKRIKKEKVANLQGKPFDIVLIGGAPQAVNALPVQTRTWRVEASTIDADSLTGAIRLLPEQEAASVKKIKGTQSERLSEYRIIMYLDHKYAQSLPDTLTSGIPLAQVKKMEIYEFRSGGSVVKTALVTTGVVLAFFVILLATKGSCPFIYAENPDGRELEGEIYSGTTFPQLERHDWLPLPGLRQTQGQYRITIANKVHEIQHTNLLELIAVDHPPGTSVLYDKFGNLHTMAGTQPPVSAIALGGRDVRDQIIREDSLQFTGAEENTTPDACEELLLQFQRQQGARQAKLVVRAKNSLWMDYAHGLLQDEFGAYAGKIRQRYLQKSAEALQRHILEQNMPLSVWLETAPGQWERAGYFNLAGPIALKRDVLPLDLSRVQGDQIRIKLRYGFMFWEIDYAGLDFSADQPVSVRALAPVSAVDQDGADRMAALCCDDTSYYHQPNIGDEAVVAFPAPALPQGLQRTAILHSKGHYEILRPAAPGRPGVRYLKQFTKPNAFPVFARAQWQAMFRDTNLSWEAGGQPLQ